MEEWIFKYAKPQVFNLTGDDEFAHGDCYTGSKDTLNCQPGNVPGRICKSGTAADCWNFTTGKCSAGAKASGPCLTGTSAAYTCVEGTTVNNSNKCCNTGYN
ncbi:MAG: hypothetical protein NTV99_07625, partial [Deltaproteobacteria bacterium]|nr:hypothetical protein [Deltaproteobacteria bacterium]